MEKQKPIGLENYSKFDPVKETAYKSLVTLKGLPKFRRKYCTLHRFIWIKRFISKSLHYTCIHKSTANDLLHLMTL